MQLSYMCLVNIELVLFSFYVYVCMCMSICVPYVQTCVFVFMGLRVLYILHKLVYDIMYTQFCIMY